MIMIVYAQFEQCGLEDGVGFTVNVPWCGGLSPPMGDAEYMAAFRSVVMPIANDFQPDIILVSCGFDAANGHPAPLGGYRVTPACFGWMTQQLMTIGHGKVSVSYFSASVFLTIVHDFLT
jgi:histone deacetylase 4/5